MGDVLTCFQNLMNLILNGLGWWHCNGMTYDKCWGLDKLNIGSGWKVASLTTGLSNENIDEKWEFE